MFEQKGGAVLLDLWSSEDEEDALYNEWKNQLLRKSIAKSSLLKVRSTSNNTYFTKGKVFSFQRPSYFLITISQG